MEGCFKLAPLRGDRMLQAYPLVREVFAGVTVEAWRAYAEDLLHGKLAAGEARDIIGVCSANGYLRGLFTYHVVPDVHHGRTLMVEYFTVDGVFASRALGIVLIEGVETVAREHRCNAIHAHLPPRPNWLTALLCDRGYQHDAWRMCKPVPRGEPPCR